MSGCCSAIRRSTSAARARTELMFQDAILMVVTEVDVATLFSLCERSEHLARTQPRTRPGKRPSLRGHGARANQAFATQGIQQTPGNRGKPGALQNRASI